MGTEIATDQELSWLGKTLLEEAAEGMREDEKTLRERLAEKWPAFSDLTDSEQAETVERLQSELWL